MSAKVTRVSYSWILRLPGERFVELVGACSDEDALNRAEATCVVHGERGGTVIKTTRTDFGVGQ